jgi:hypothetical protein
VWEATWEEWNATPPEYRTIIDGWPYRLVATEQGTCLCPLKITDAPPAFLRQLKKARRAH